MGGHSVPPRGLCITLHPQARPACLRAVGVLACLPASSGAPGVGWWEELTFPQLPPSAKCRRSTFTNVISISLYNNPLKRYYLCFADEATVAQMEGQSSWREPMREVAVSRHVFSLSLAACGSECSPGFFSGLILRLFWEAPPGCSSPHGFSLSISPIQTTHWLLPVCRSLVTPLEMLYVVIPFLAT